MNRFQMFRRDETGSLSIEFVMWLPVFAFLLVLAGDATMAFMNQSRMWQVSRETARIVSRYGMDELTAEAYAAKLATMQATVPTVDVSFASAKVQVEMTMPLAAMAPFGLLDFAMSNDITVTVTHAMEPI
ncbi:TadE/TadG family type IV pilus assembly protein [Tropicimonas sp. IMCC6043]|uniref:TadE/TadG family type IV pilus assembly protein n=1 Tax=Tropicimonas sp. IMCC6043 TaxID=2510645 RepID=UPI00101C581F|nr:TadE/TadG family type IV pilus assembly protein [Tropicimonas sp. IMCC6043]RYH10377.1 hypothetical protein EU800_08815 [Tropicimonas sp. IMCC6043]